MSDPREAVRLLGLLAAPERMRVAAALVLGARGLDEIRAATGLDARAAGGALARLVAGDLVRETPEGYELATDLITDAVAEAAPAADDDDHGASDPSAAAVLRAFLTGGRIASFPAQQGRRRLLLEHVVSVFEIGVRYPEKEVDTMLRAFHDDHAMLRRYLVDADLLSRDHNVYWRTGGPVDV